MPVLLDTTVLIDFLRGRAGARARLADIERVGDTPVTSAVNVEEVFRGLHPIESGAAESFLRGLRMAPLGRAEGIRAGTWRRDHARKGITLTQSDCLIAAAALAVGGRLATGNPRHFPFDELTVEHWPVGE